MTAEMPFSGMREHIERLREAHRLVEAAVRGLEHLTSSSALEILKGTPYARYALPLEYAPSRDLKPRWGFDKPMIMPLAEHFRRGEGDFAEWLRAMRQETPHMIDVPLEFREENLPQPAWQGVPYNPFDSVALYTMIKRMKPKRYVEIGSGITTCFARRAISDGGLGTVLTSIDPQPRASIDGICDHVVREGLEMMDIAYFDALEADDILFFDGSHRSFMNSDVTVFFIDVLPRIKPGVIVHIHDIALPWDYDPMFVNWYWNEQYILAVYLMGNLDRVDVMLPTAWICRQMAQDAFFSDPGVEIGGRDNWLGGGAMWFRKRS